MIFSAAVLLQHALFLFLLVVTPAWDYSYMRRLKREPGSARRIGVYRTLCAWLWIASVMALLAVGFRPLVTFGPATWLDTRWVRWTLETVTVLFAAGMLLPYATVLWKKLAGQPRKYASAEALKSLMWFLPSTTSERRWFAAVSVTAGVCEELLFRGFLLRYLHVFPGKLSLTTALLVAAAIFGIQHLYQGAIGSVVSGVIGLLLSLVFLLTGSLLAPMVLHAVMDLRMLVILPPASEKAAA